jgi:hypothetical protein
MASMLWFLVAYLAGSFTATLLYVSLAHRLEASPDADPEAEWWEAFAQTRRRLGHDPSHADVLRELRRAA